MAGVLHSARVKNLNSTCRVFIGKWGVYRGPSKQKIRALCEALS